LQISLNDWKRDFTKRAISKGYNRAEVTRLIALAKINPLALERDKKQPEFVKPIWSYVEGAASQTRIQEGQAKLQDTQAIFDQLDAAYGVPRHVLTAIWGLETSYGRILGRHNIIDALSTFAFDGRRMAFGEEQLFAVLDLLKSKAGNKDLWTSRADALGSAAHYLLRQGWQKGAPILAEVKVPSGFDFSVADGRKKTLREWEALGIAPFAGQNWSNSARQLDAKLLVPAGESGPKLLTFKNFDVIKRYNNSTSYVLGITTLANALRGQKTIQTSWPKGETPLTLSERKTLQQKLTDKGYDTYGIDGQIGPNTRKAIRAWQAANGFAQDGYITRAQFAKISSR